MANQITDITVFISCPGNLNELRGVAVKAIEEISDTIKVTHQYSLTPISWKEDIVPGVASDGQEVINAQTIGQYDVYLGIIGSKFGTKTIRAGSGTEEEFDLALNSYHEDPTSIRLLFYLQAFGVNPFQLDIEELSKVQLFKKKLQEKGVLYHELYNLDEALKNIKSHLLHLVVNEWDKSSIKWKSPRTSSSLTTVSLQVTHVIENDSNQSEVVSEDDSIDDLGLLELISAGNQELMAAAASIAQVGSNLDELTSATGKITANLDSESAKEPAQIMQAVNLYSLAIDNFLKKSRGEIAVGKDHLFRGAELIEAYYAQTAELKLNPSESADDIAAAAESIEPSLKGFRSSVLEAKNGASKLPPLTKKFKLSKSRLISYFDSVSVDITVFIERLSLMRERLATVSEKQLEAHVAISQIAEG